MRTGVTDDAQEYYIHEEEIRGMHVIMGNVETESNGRRGRKEHVVMEYFPCGQVKYPLDYKPLIPRHKTTSGH
jgi:hypothetical protein